MIIKKRYGCCSGKRLNGFGAAITDFDTLYVAAAGARTLQDMALVISEWLCGNMPSTWYSAVANGMAGMPSTIYTLGVALRDGDMALQSALVFSAWSLLSNNRTIASSASCYTAQVGSTPISTGNATIDQILAIGKTTVAVAASATGTNTGSNKPPEGVTAGGVKPTPKTTLNIPMLVGLGAAGVAAYLLLGKKKG